MVSLYAQVDTSILIPAINVEGFKVRESAIGGVVSEWDSAALQANPRASFGDILQSESNVFVKTYGNNSLSTLSVRGASASQTLVTWNGLPVQSTMLGLLDLSLIPGAFADKLQLETGGNSSSGGSGAIGGVLAFEQRTSFQHKVNINYASSFGSFGSLHQGLSLQFGNKFFQSRTQVVYQKATNNIRYEPAPGKPKLRQDNARFEQPAIMQTFAFQAKKHHLFEVHLWLQKSYKEIPATLTQSKSEAYQEDRFKRVMASYKFLKGKSKLNAKAGFFDDRQFYNDPQIVLSADNDFTNILTELNYAFQFNRKHLIELTNSNVITKAKSASYEQVEKLNRFALLFTYKMQLKKLAFQISVREEVANKKVLLPLGYAGLEYSFNKHFTLKSKLTRDFRLPTLNDLYWSPGGNVDLKAEQGWGQELSLEFDKKKGKHQFFARQTVYNRNINDWILWAPSTTNFYWEASNIAKVWSWGTETKLDYAYTQAKWHIGFTSLFSFTSSTYRIDLELPKINKGDQLLYTPKIQANNSIAFGFGPWSVDYSHMVVGETQAVNGVLEKYHVANLTNSFHFNQAKTATRLFVSINNIYNQNYIVVERRPSPGINYQIGMQLNFKN